MKPDPELSRMKGNDGIEAEAPDGKIVAAILHALRHLRYGSVEIVVHDSKVVQIERREKLRYDGAGARR